MSWLSLTASNFQAKLLAQEYTALSAIGVQEGKTWEEVFADELTRTTNYVRGFCPASTALGAAGTIPDEVEDAAYAILRYKFFTRFPKLKQLLTEERKDEFMRAEELLQRWSNNKFRVVRPTTPADTDAQPAGPSAELLDADTSDGWNSYNMNGL